ncbi:MAG: tRNA 2-thiouridine(34) synthase MnmA [Sedimentisphaerales bacterium]|nr:tRNA 2-thiouridine(34) synthase MnmA [Sedimentisphaerales bacterium]
MNSEEHVFVAMSGGVDSSVSAALLKQEGYHCSGLFMITNDQTQAHRSDAQRVADQLDIELHVLDLRPEFERIIQYFCDEYAVGRTPNPCVFCNRYIKFGLLWEYARDHGASRIATGHYARILHQNGRAGLYAASNPEKDQSYVLSMVPRERLEYILLPLGSQTKDQTRSLASKVGLHIEQKPDSQEICFIPDDNHVGLLEQRCPDLVRQGKVVDTSGKVLGEHTGLHRFTIGQRRGLGIALGQPAYVIGLDTQTNTVILGSQEEVMNTSLRALEVNWLIDPPEQAVHGKIKIRYNHHGAPGIIRPLGTDANEVQVQFDEPVSAITPGQTAVFYLHNNLGWQVAGGGWIQ